MKALGVSFVQYDTWLISGGDNTSKTLCFQPTAHGLPPMMLKPRDPPSRRRTAVTLLVSPSYRQTEKKHMIKKTAGRGFEIIPYWLQLSNRRTEPSTWRRRRIQQEKSLSTQSSIQSIIYLINRQMGLKHEITNRTRLKVILHLFTNWRLMWKCRRKSSTVESKWVSFLYNKIIIGLISIIKSTSKMQELHKCTYCM